MRESELESVHTWLIATGMFATVQRGAEQQRWKDYNLALLAEGRVG
jgi:hypothetical protein